MNSNWLDSYYEALEFFYWEPQHIGRKKNVAGEFNTLEKVTKHLRKIEVTLNHNINQFLLIAPKSLHRRLFFAFFSKDFQLPFQMHGRGIDANFELVGAMQPDFLFISNDEVLSIEMKVAAKSSLEQVMKYVLLGLAVELKEGTQKMHHLGFLGAGRFQDQWKEKYKDIDSLRIALQSFEINAFLNKQPLKFRPFASRLRAILAEMEFGFVNYESIAAILRTELRNLTEQSPASEAYSNLIEGVLSELRTRDLAGDA